MTNKIFAALALVASLAVTSIMAPVERSESPSTSSGCPDFGVTRISIANCRAMFLSDKREIALEVGVELRFYPVTGWFLSGSSPAISPNNGQCNTDEQDIEDAVLNAVRRDRFFFFDNTGFGQYILDGAHLDSHELYIGNLENAHLGIHYSRIEQASILAHEAWHHEGQVHTGQLDFPPDFSDCMPGAPS